MLRNLTALALGALGSAHCISMCGPVAGLCAVSSNEARPSLGRTLAFNAGRIATYALLGATVGWLGGTVNALYGIAPQAGAALRFLAATVAIAAGIALLSGKSALASLENFARPLGHFVRARARPWLAQAHLHSFLVLGFLWGLVPCGLVYSALALAATSGSAAAGAFTMSLFGAGTAPALVLVGLASRAVRSLSSMTIVRRGAGTLLIVAGAVQLADTIVPAKKEPCCHHSAAVG